MSDAPIGRRKFLKHSVLGVAGGAILGADVASHAGLLKKKCRAAVIGSTGRGDFGHGLDKAFLGLPGVELVALADDNPKGLQAAGKRNGVDKLYADYRQMLEKEKPDVVAVAMRQSVWHADIVVDCARAGAHVFCEKPIAPDLESADRMLAACKANGVKIAVSMQNRASLQVEKAVEAARAGRIGQVLSARGRGKEDSRGGGEDLIVLGTHILDLMRLFCGDPLWTSAHVTNLGKEMTRADAQEGREPNGPMAGDRLAAMYGFPGGVHGYFESHRGLEASLDRFNIEIVGSKGVIAMRSLCPAMIFEGPVFNPAREHEWRPLVEGEWPKTSDVMHECNQRLILDLLRAGEEDRKPLCSGDDARWSLEMILSVYASHLSGGRVALPMKNRAHPLGIL